LSLRLCFRTQRDLNGASTAYEVHDDRDQSEDEQQVNQKAANVQDEESAQPKQNQNNSQNKEHKATFFLGKSWR
jgi:hypothetical protein